MAIGGITSNARAFGQHLARVRRQVPFAAAQALTTTAFSGRRRVVERTYPQAFEVRNKGFARRAFRVKKARKTDLVAAVFDDLGRANLLLHARGGVKRPRGGSLAVPSKNVRRGTRGVVKGQRPEALRGNPKVFKKRLRKPEPALWQETRRGLKLLYTMERAVRLRRRFRFEEDLTRLVRAELPINYRRALAHAIRTAR
mgnify:CR=1 FL=1